MKTLKLILSTIYIVLFYTLVCSVIYEVAEWDERRSSGKERTVLFP
ncbi:hypothetical protein ACFX5L_09200 [Bacteroides sp. KG123]